VEDNRRGYYPNSKFSKSYYIDGAALLAHACDLDPIIRPVWEFVNSSL